MIRGSIWTIAGGGAYSGKPRPAVIVQDNFFDDLGSITICPLTSIIMDVEAVRPRIEPDQSNGLKSVSQVMIDKITTLPKTRLGVQIGMLGDEDMVRVNRSLAVFLGIGGSRA